jgi:hypothetical protein
MAALNLGDTPSRLTIVCANDEGVPISFPLANDGFARVNSLRLSLRFRMSEDFMFIDKEVYDALSRNLINTIEQSLCDGDSKQWMLGPGRFECMV